MKSAGIQKRLVEMRFGGTLQSLDGLSERFQNKVTGSGLAQLSFSEKDTTTPQTRTRWGAGYAVTRLRISWLNLTRLCMTSLP